jgi:hypothetical protein
VPKVFGMFERIFLFIIFFVPKVECFLGVNSNLTVQNMVENIYIFSVLHYISAQALSNRKNQSFLSFLCSEIFSHESTKIFEVQVILTAPTVQKPHKTPRKF